MSSALNSLGYKRTPMSASSLDVGSLSKLNNWQMSVYAPSGIPKPPTNSYTAFFDSTNSNKLSVKDSSGTVTLVGGSGGGSGNGNFQALVGPTETYTSVQAAVTAGFWRLRITGTFTEPSAISFTALSLNPDILIFIDQGVTWTTANIITYTSGGNITFTGGGTFKYTVGGTGAIVLTAGKRVTFDTCNITNAASVNTCRLASSTTEVFIMNSTITVPNQNNCLMNSSAFVYMNGCTFMGGGSNLHNMININIALLCNINTSNLTVTNVNTLLTASGGIYDNIYGNSSESKYTSCLLSNLNMTSLNFDDLYFGNCGITNISYTNGRIFSPDIGNIYVHACNVSLDTYIGGGTCVLVNSTHDELGTDTNTIIILLNGRANLVSASWDNGSICNFYTGTGSNVFINRPATFTNCTFYGNTTTGIGIDNVHLDNCKIIGTLTIGSGSNHKVSNTVVTSSIAITGSQVQISNSRCTSMTVNATRCIVTKCVLSSTLSIGSSASAQGSVFSNNIVTGTTSTDGSTRSDDLVFTGNNLIGAVTVSAGATANHEPLFFGNKIEAGGATATGPTNSHNNSGNNSRP